MIVFPDPQKVEENDFLRAWLQKRLKDTTVGPETWCLGICRDDKLVAVAGFTNYRTVDIEILMAADHPRWATRQTFAWILAFPFIQLQTQRCTAMVLKSNKRVRKLLLGAGFREEGRHLHAARNLETMLSYGITRAYYMQRYGTLRNVAPELTKANHSDSGSSNAKLNGNLMVKSA